MKPKAAVHLRGIKMMEFIAKAKFVQTQLQDPLFATITPTPAEMMPLLKQLESFYNQTESRNYTNMDSRNALFHELKQMYSSQCMAVNGLAQGDLNILKKSGFDLAKTASKPGVAPAPRNVRGMRGYEAWHVKVRFTSVPTRYYYEVHVTDAAGKHHYYTCRNTTLIITDLEPNQEIQIRVRTINSSGVGVYSVSTCYYIPRGVSKARTPQAA
jgi:hypothetical protein